MNDVNDRFKEDLARLGKGAGPVALSAWLSLVFRAIRRRGAGIADVEDVTQDLLQDLWDLANENSGSWRQLCDMDERLTRQWLAERARWLWGERLPDSPARHALRGIIAESMREGLPVAGPPPASLRVHGRFSRRLVGQAVAWAKASSPVPLIHLWQIVDVLFMHWGGELRPSAAPDPVDAETAFRLALDASGLANAAIRSFAGRDLKIFGLWARGHTFDEIAQCLKIGKATAHRAVKKVTSFLESPDTNFGTALTALDLLLLHCRNGTK